MSEADKDTTVRIVVGVDWSNTGDVALREAMRIAKPLPDSELHVTYVIVTDGKVNDARKLKDISEQLESRLDDLRGHVATVCAPGDGEEAFKQETVFHLRVGDPVAALHQVAVDVDADLIVVGTHGRTGTEKLMLGSVAERLIREARLPVLVAHAKDFSGLEPTPKPEAGRPGDDLTPKGLTDRLHLEFRPKGGHISGLV